jgi:hypothetical protein
MNETQAERVGVRLGGSEVAAEAIARVTGSCARCGRRPDGRSSRLASASPWSPALREVLRDHMSVASWLHADGSRRFPILEDDRAVGVRYDAGAALADELAPGAGRSSAGAPSSRGRRRAREHAGHRDAAGRTPRSAVRALHGRRERRPSVFALGPAGAGQRAETCSPWAAVLPCELPLLLPTFFCHAIRTERRSHDAPSYPK